MLIEGIRRKYRKYYFLIKYVIILEMLGHVIHVVSEIIASFKKGNTLT